MDLMLFYKKTELLVIMIILRWIPVLVYHERDFVIGIGSSSRRFLDSCRECMATSFDLYQG